MTTLYVTCQQCVKEGSARSVRRGVCGEGRIFVFFDLIQNVQVRALSRKGWKRKERKNPEAFDFFESPCPWDGLLTSENGRETKRTKEPAPGPTSLGPVVQESTASISRAMSEPPITRIGR